MNETPLQYKTSKLYQEYATKEGSKKVKKKCCFKYQKKKGKYCKGCPTLHLMLNGSRRSL